MTNLTLLLALLVKVAKTIFEVGESLRTVLYTSQVKNIATEYIHTVPSNIGLNVIVHVCRRVCTEENINKIDATREQNTTGPIVYLMKLLVRQSGLGVLKQITDKRHHWVVPGELQEDEANVTFIKCYCTCTYVYTKSILYVGGENC